jgi:hypothetical protein
MMASTGEREHPSPSLPCCEAIPRTKQERCTMKNSLRRRGPTSSFTKIRRGSLQRLSNTTTKSSYSALNCGTILAVLAAALVIDPRRHQAPLAASGFSLDHPRPALASRLRSHRAAVSSASSTSDENPAPAVVNNNSDNDGGGEDWDGSTVVQMDHYDVVTVDLDAGRDYPIYIGTGYSDEEGAALEDWIGLDSGRWISGVGMFSNFRFFSVQLLLHPKPRSCS